MIALQSQTIIDRHDEVLFVLIGGEAETISMSDVPRKVLEVRSMECLDASEKNFAISAMWSELHSYCEEQARLRNRRPWFAYSICGAAIVCGVVLLVYCWGML